MQLKQNLPESPQIHFPLNRIVFMGILLLVAGAGILVIRDIGVQQSEKLTAAEKAPKEKHDFSDPIPPGDPIALPPDMAAMINEETGRSTIEEAPYRELMSQVYNRTSRFLREVLKYREADYDSIMNDPARYRGKTLFVRGELVDFHERLLDKPIGDYVRVHFGVIKDNQGNLFWFDTLSFDEEHILDVGQIVIAEGVFFKIFKYIQVPGTPFNLKDLPAVVDRIPMLICRSVRRSYTISEVTTLDKKLVRSAAWRELGDQETLEPRPFHHLMGYMKNLTSDEIPGKIKTYDDMAERLLLPTKLDKYRGEWVSLWGRLGPIYKHPCEENPAGIQYHYRAYVKTSDGKLVEAIVTDKPVGFKPYRDLVMIRGIFFKPRVWEAEGGQTVRAPVIVAKSLKHMKVGPSIWTYIALGMAGLLSVAVFFIFFVIYRERRSIKKYNEEFIRRRRERRLKGLTRGHERRGGQPTESASEDFRISRE